MVLKNIKVVTGLLYTLYTSRKLALSHNNYSNKGYVAYIKYKLVLEFIFYV